MEYSVFIEILTLTLRSRIIRYGIVLLIGIIGFIVSATASVYPTKKAKAKKKELTVKKSESSIIMSLILVITSIYLFCTNVLPIYRDIQHEQYIQAQGKYVFDDLSYNKAKRKGSLLSSVNVEIITDDAVILLKLPEGRNIPVIFPKEDQDGTIWYAQDSKIILLFISGQEKDLNPDLKS